MGASVVAVARLLGHELAATTLNHYAGLFPSDLDDPPEEKPKALTGIGRQVLDAVWCSRPVAISASQASSRCS